MSLEYVDDTSHYTGEVAYVCVSGRTPRPRKRDLHRYTEDLVKVMGRRDFPYITAEERGRLVEHLVAAAVEHHGVYPEARDGRR